MPVELCPGDLCASESPGNLSAHQICNRNIETQGYTSSSSLFEEVYEGLLLDDAVVVRDLVEPGDVVLVQRHALAGQVVHQSADLDTVPAVTALGEYLNTDIEEWVLDNR